MPPLRKALFIGALFALLKLAFHLLAARIGPYGYFRDEFYYLDCANNLAWGYVDQPPLSLFILRIARVLLGDSVVAVRLPAILAESGTLLLTALLVRELGGRTYAQVLACLALLLAPVFLTLGSFFSMNAFDHLFWVAAALLLARIVNTGNPGLWIPFGLVAGLGMQNKFSMGFFCGAMALAMLFTRERRHFLSWQLYAGGAIALLIFLPHILWQATHGWVTLEFMRETSLYKNVPVTAGKFVTGQLLFMGPLTALVWVAGLVCALFFHQGKWRIFGIIYLLLLAVFYWTNAKSYYVAPAYPMLLALGGVAWEALTRRHAWTIGILATLVAVSNAALAPHAMPLLPPEELLRYQEAMHLKAPQQELAHSGPLPQHIGDRLGWEEYAQMVAAAFKRLSPEDQQKCVVLVSNYGEAGALNLWQAKLGLPRRAISGYMNYYLWGPGDATGEVVLAYWDERETLDDLFTSVEEVDRFEHPYVMNRQNHRALYLCRGLKVPWAEAWPRFKRFH